MMVRATRQGWAIFAVMFMLMLVGVGIAAPVEQHGSQVLHDDRRRAGGHGRLAAGGNMSDKEIRFGIANSALWAHRTTAASNGSVNSGHDAFTGRRRSSR